MADTFTWIKSLPDMIKSYVMLIPWLLTGLGAVTGGYQYFDKQDVIEKAVAEKNTAVREVATAFQSVITELEPEKKGSDCGQCAVFIRNHQQKEH